MAETPPLLPAPHELTWKLFLADEAAGATVPPAGRFSACFLQHRGGRRQPEEAAPHTGRRPAGRQSRLLGPEEKCYS